MIGGRLGRGAGLVLGTTLLVLLILPLLALVVASRPDEVMAGLRHELFLPALVLSVQTSVLSTAIIVLLGTPLAWGLATRSGRWVRAVEAVVDLPIVIPPAVVGVALLLAYGRSGLLGPPLDALGLALPFTTAAVVMAQVVVAAPFYVSGATSAFREVDPDLMLVARTLGASGPGAFLRVAVPVAAEGLFAAVALSWARAVGEFGATLLFAGSLTGRTMTLPLAIYSALEQDVAVAQALALVLCLLALTALAGIRAVPALWAWRRA